MTGATLENVPNEVVFKILFNLSPSDAISAVRTSRRYYAFLGPPLWRHFCQAKFEFWQESWHIEKAFEKPVESVNWKAIYLRRQEVERSTATLLELILQAQPSRLVHYESILTNGWDVKDVLLRQLSVSDDAEDVLARRYHSSLLLNTIHRKKALEVWERVAKGESVTLEKAMAAFEMFLWKEKPEGFENISARLDAVATKFHIAEPDIFGQTTRQKALSLARFLRAQGFRDPDNPDSYGDLRNHFIGAALQTDSHPCVPLILVTIYSCIASRIGLDAKLCCVPFHVFAQIRSPTDVDLDSQPCKDGAQNDLMYMDPYRTDQEVSSDDLTSSLRRINASQSMYETVTKASSTPEILLRAARNIIFSADILRGRPDRDELLVNQQRNPRDVDGAFYGALSALLLLSQSAEKTDLLVSPLDRTQCIQYLFDLLHLHYPIELLNFQRFAKPFFDENTRHLNFGCNQLIVEDTKAKLQKLRTQAISRKVLYRVGQVFLHKRYAYRAVIIGWDPKCAAKESWIRQMGVHQLPGGKTQSFYKVMAEHRRFYYVAEENIKVITPEYPQELMPVAGEYFKRWDETQRQFVNNIRDEYPDD